MEECRRASWRRCMVRIATDGEMGMTFVQSEGKGMRKGREV